jgi:hypothetical protein
MSRLNTRRADQAISAGGGDARKTLKGLIATNDFLRLRFGRPDLSSFVTYDPRIVGGPTAEHTPSPVRSAP